MSWDWLMERSVLIPESKNHTARAVPMPEWVRDDLRAWRIASGLRRGLVFPRSPEDLRPINSGTWTREVWATALGRILGEDAYVRPYHLRHSRVSMWIAEGHDVQQVARWAGHRPEETLKTYAHLFEDRDTRNPLRTNEVVLRVRQMFVEGHRGKLPAGSLDVLTPREADGAF
jgi:integrase